AAVERFTVRPEAATFLLLATYLLVLDRASLGLRALVALVVLQAVWANLHALSVLGLVVLGAELVSAAAARWLPLPPGWRHASRRDGRAVAGLAAATAGAIAAEAATPFGLAGALFPLRRRPRARLRARDRARGQRRLLPGVAADTDLRPRRVGSPLPGRRRGLPRRRSAVGPPLQRRRAGRVPALAGLSAPPRVHRRPVP